MMDNMRSTETAQPPETATDSPVSLFQADEGRGFRTRWDAIQTGFVDEPRAAVEYERLRSI